jgi:adenylosuccinate synthase
LVNPISLFEEIEALKELNIDIKSQLFISERAHLILPTHRLLDKSSELSKGKKKIGSTLKGIGPTYMDKTGRNGVRVGDIFQNLEEKVDSLRDKHFTIMNNVINAEKFEQEMKSWYESIEKLKQLNIIDSEYYINQALSEGKSVLAEGGQG